MIFKSGALTVIKSDKIKGQFSGYAAVYGKAPNAFGPRGGTFLQPGALTKTVNEANAAGKLFKVLWNHNQDQPIGTASVDLDAKGLSFTAQLNIDKDPDTGIFYNPEAIKTFSNISNNIIDEMSIGFDIIQFREEVEKEQLHLTETKLRELSPVTFPANEDATIDAAFSAMMKTLPESDQNAICNNSALALFIKKQVSAEIASLSLTPEIDRSDLTSTKAKAEDKPERTIITSRALEAFSELNSKLQKLIG